MAASLNKDAEDYCICEKGWKDLHEHVWMEVIVITGGFIVMVIYKHIWKRLGRKIMDSEMILVTFFGSALILYATYAAFNRKLVTTAIY